MGITIRQTRTVPRRVAQLRENERDLQVVVQDLSDEILTREAQLLDAMRQLRETRALLRLYLRTVPCDGAAA